MACASILHKTSPSGSFCVGIGFHLGLVLYCTSLGLAKCSKMRYTRSEVPLRSEKNTFVCPYPRDDKHPQGVIGVGTTTTRFAPFVPCCVLTVEHRCCRIVRVMPVEPIKDDQLSKQKSSFIFFFGSALWRIDICNDPLPCNHSSSGIFMRCEV